MREIIFKAKDNTGEWVKGGYHFDSFTGYHVIVEWGAGGDIEYVIDRKTLCQYIGREDYKGNKIFEGDILEINYHLHNEEIKLKGNVGFEDGCFKVRLTNNSQTKIGGKNSHYFHKFPWCFIQAKVIGNIHD